MGPAAVPPDRSRWRRRSPLDEPKGVAGVIVRLRCREVDRHRIHIQRRVWQVAPDRVRCRAVERELVHDRDARSVVDERQDDVARCDRYSPAIDKLERYGMWSVGLPDGRQRIAEIAP
jgi:hypothetical protein